MSGQLQLLYEYAENKGSTTVAPTLGVRPGCSQYCTPSYGCLSICCWRKALLMTLEAVRAGCEAEDLVQLSLARTWGLRRWRRCPGWRKFTLDFWTVIFIPRELLSQIQNPKQR